VIDGQLLMNMMPVHSAPPNEPLALPNGRARLLKAAIDESG
jgi:hypothetical protein